MDENLKSMGDIGKANFKEEIVSSVVTNNDAVVAVNDSANGTEVNNNEGTKTVEDVIKEKEQEEIVKKEEVIVNEREADAIKKAEEFFGRKQEELKTVVDDKINTTTSTVSNDDSANTQEAMTKAKQVVEAANRVKKAYEERERTMLQDNKGFKVDILEKDIEIKSLRAKVEEMANDKASDSNNFIKTNDMRLRYLANIKSRREQDPENETLKAKEVEYLVDELSIHTPHITPEQLRKFITKQEESIEVMPNNKTDYKEAAKVIADNVSTDKKKDSLFRAIGRKKINYDKF